MILKKTLLSIFKFFGLKISINKLSSNTNWKYLDLNLWTPFNDETNKFFKIYKDGMVKSNSIKQDNTFKQIRFYSLMIVVENILKSKKIENFAECGCWKGHSTFCISTILQKNNFKKNFFVFDSFDGGLSNKIDKDLNKKRYIQNINEIKNQKNFFYSDLNEVKKLLNQFKFVKIFKSWIPRDFHKISNYKFSFVHLDVDLYEPTFNSLDFFYPRLLKGGVIVCDDYNSSDFPGASIAVNEFVLKNKFTYFYEVPLGGCILIK